MSKVINFLNLQNGQTFSYDGDIHNRANLKDKKSKIAARVQYSDILSHSFKIASNLPKQELLVKIELKMYEDIGLDPTKAYKITYIEKKRSSDNEMLIEAFAIDKSAILQKYNQSLKGIKHIDFLAIPFLTFHTLYRNRILEPKNDIFVYISEDEAFTTSYKDGHYISSKRIKSLNDMVNDLNSRNISITTEELKETLATKGLDKSSYDLLHYDLHEYLVEAFEELFSKIKNLSLHNRNVYNFTQIDRIFISFSGGAIAALDEHVLSYVEGAKINTLDFLKTEDINRVDAITASYVKDMFEDDNHDHNLTLFEKKAPFYKSEVGKLTFATIAAVVLSAIYPTYLYLEIDSKTKENEILKEKEAVVSKSSKKLKKELKKLNDEIAKLKALQKDDHKKLLTLKSIANSLLELKSKDTKYTAMLLKINKTLQNYKLSIDKITQEDDHVLNLELSSKDRKRDTIALMMKDLQQKGFSSVTSNEIVVDDENMYKSIITVKR